MKLSNLSRFVATFAALLTLATLGIGCQTYGGSVPLDDDAGMTAPEGSVDASVPIDDEAGAAPTGGAPKP